MTNERIRAKLLEVKELTDVQDKATKMVEIADEYDDLFEVYDQFSIDSNQVLENDIYNEAIAGNYQSIKNKLEGITDFSKRWYYSDGNGNFNDLTMENVDDCIDEMISRLD